MSLKDNHLDADQVKLLNAIKTMCFDPLDKKQTAMAKDVTELKTDVTELKTDVTELKAGQKALEAGQADLKKELGEVKQSLNNHLSQDHKVINEKLDKLLKK